MSWVRVESSTLHCLVWWTTLDHINVKCLKRFSKTCLMYYSSSQGLKNLQFFGKRKRQKNLNKTLSSIKVNGNKWYNDINNIMIYYCNKSISGDVLQCKQNKQHYRSSIWVSLYWETCRSFQEWCQVPVLLFKFLMVGRADLWFTFGSQVGALHYWCLNLYAVF